MLLVWLHIGRDDASCALSMSITPPATRVYGLLAAAMREAGRVALAQFVSQGKERTAPHPKPPTLHCARSPRPSPGRGSHGREGYRRAARQAYAGSPQLVRERQRLAELGCS